MDNLVPVERRSGVVIGCNPANAHSKRIAKMRVHQRGRAASLLDEMYSRVDRKYKTNQLKADKRDVGRKGISRVLYSEWTEVLTTHT